MRKKNFSLPDRFRQEWFLELSANFQVFYDYIERNVSFGGLWAVNIRDYERICKRKIDAEKFLREVNKITKRISVLNEETWFLHYYVAETFGPVYNPKYDKMVSHLKNAFLSGVPLEWIKGFFNPEKINKEVIENSYVKKQTKFVRTENTDKPNDEIKPITKKIKLKGSVAAFVLPEVSYEFCGNEQDYEVEEWLETQDFTHIIRKKKILKSEHLKQMVEQHILDVQTNNLDRRDYVDISRWFLNREFDLTKINSARRKLPDSKTALKSLGLG